jgi:hypothetical protein
MNQRRPRPIEPSSLSQQRARLRQQQLTMFRLERLRQGSSPAVRTPPSPLTEPPQKHLPPAP